LFYSVGHVSVDESSAVDSAATNQALPTTPTKKYLRCKIAMYRKRTVRLKKRLQHANAMIQKLSKRQSDIDTAKNIISQHISGNAYNLVVAQLTMSLRRNKKNGPKT